MKNENLLRAQFLDKRKYKVQFLISIQPIEIRIDGYTGHKNAEINKNLILDRKTYLFPVLDRGYHRFDIFKTDYDFVDFVVAEVVVVEVVVHVGDVLVVADSYTHLTLQTKIPHNIKHVTL